MLKDTGLLSDKICQGWDPLFIQVDIEIEEKECVVCGDKRPFDRFPESITTTCTHNVNTCRKCLRKWIKTALASNGWDKIKCPECKELLQHADMHVNASSKQFQKYVSLL
jgi:phage FluMu protein Com